MATLKKTLTVRLHDTDSAGILFFANQLVYAHDLYEELLQHIDLPMASILRDEPFILPIVYTESQYSRPLRFGDEISVSVRIGGIGRTSFVLEYELLDRDRRLVGNAKTVHVAVSKETQQKMTLPNKLLRALQEFQSAP